MWVRGWLEVPPEDWGVVWDWRQGVELGQDWFCHSCRRWELDLSWTLEMGDQGCVLD